MNQQPDKLFREKLEGYHRQAPELAWDKIDAGIQKKSNKGLYWKIAASLLVVAVASYTLWPSANTNNHVAESTEIITPSKTFSTKKVEEAIPAKQENVSPAPSPVAKVEIKSLPVTHKKVEPVKTEKHQHEEVVQEKIISEAIAPASEDNTIAMAEVETLAEQSANASVVTTPASQQTVTLVVSAKEADEYLDKKGLAQATSKEKKSSTLKKLLKKADDLANDQDPFGELRQKKNEILALNFKSEKQREQNK